MCKSTRGHPNYFMMSMTRKGKKEPYMMEKKPLTAAVASEEELSRV